MTLLAVALAGACGAPLRLVAERLVTRRFGHGFPWGTLAVNYAGAFAAGLVAGTPGAIEGSVRAALVVGLLGAFTTFSTFTNETVRLVESDRAGRAGAYVALTVVGAVGGAALGIAMTA